MKEKFFFVICTALQDHIRELHINLQHTLAYASLFVSVWHFDNFSRMNTFTFVLMFLIIQSHRHTRLYKCTTNRLVYATVVSKKEIKEEKVAQQTIIFMCVYVCVCAHARIKYTQRKTEIMNSMTSTQFINCIIRCIYFEQQTQKFPSHKPTKKTHFTFAF